MSRKSRIAVMILTAALIALSMCVVPGAMAKSSSPSHVLRFKVVKRITHYDVVKGHGHRFGVRRGAHKVTVHGFGHFKLVKRTPHYVLLRALASKAGSRLKISTPNSGAFVKSTPTTIAWKTSSAVSSGYFQVSLKSTVDGASTGLTAVSIPANRKTTNYSVPWDVAQAVGSYKIWVYYYTSGGWSQMSDSSDGAVNITLAAVPTPIPPTPAPTPTATPTPTPTPTPTSAPADTFNVRSYGAKGDGTVDDRPAIQRAVDACAAAGGGTVYVPAGTYFLDSGAVPSSSYYYVGIVLKDNVQLVGDGASTQIRSSKSGLNNIGAVGAHHIAIRNLDSVGGDQDGIKLGSCDGVTISGVNAFGHYIGISAYGCTNVAVSDCTSHDNSGFGFCFGDDVVNQVPQTGSHDQSWTNCEAYNNSEGFRVHNGGSAVARNCYAHNNKTGLLATQCSGLVVDHGRFDNNAADSSGIGFHPGRHIDGQNI